MHNIFAENKLPINFTDIAKQQQRCLQANTQMLCFPQDTTLQIKQVDASNNVNTAKLLVDNSLGHQRIVIPPKFENQIIDHYHFLNYLDIKAAQRFMPCVEKLEIVYEHAPVAKDPRSIAMLFYQSLHVKCLRRDLIQCMQICEDLFQNVKDFPIYWYASTIFKFCNCLSSSQYPDRIGNYRYECLYKHFRAHASATR